MQLQTSGSHVGKAVLDCLYSMHWLGLVKAACTVAPPSVLVRHKGLSSRQCSANTYLSIILFTGDTIISDASVPRSKKIDLSTIRVQINHEADPCKFTMYRSISSSAYSTMILTLSLSLFVIYPFYPYGHFSSSIY